MLHLENSVVGSMPYFMPSLIVDFFINNGQLLINFIVSTVILEFGTC